MSQQGLEMRAVKCTLSGHHFRRADSSGCQSTHEVLLHETLHLFFLFSCFSIKHNRYFKKYGKPGWEFQLFSPNGR